MQEEELKITVYTAIDGTRFLSKAECERYENDVKNIRYFLVKHTPDLIETGLFTRADAVAVYSEHGCHREIVEMWYTKELKMPILGVGVQGCGFQRHFEIIESDGNDYVSGAWKNYEYGRKFGDGSFPTEFSSKYFLSPKRIDDFPNNIDYEDKWFVF